VNPGCRGRESSAARRREKESEEKYTGKDPPSARAALFTNVLDVSCMLHNTGVVTGGQSGHREGGSDRLSSQLPEYAHFKRCIQRPASKVRSSFSLEFLLISREEGLLIYRTFSVFLNTSLEGKLLAILRREFLAALLQELVDPSLALQFGELGLVLLGTNLA